MATKHISFANWAHIVNGVEITGFAAGDDAVSIEYNEDVVSQEIGADGRAMVSVSANKSGKITYKLQQTSSSNAYLNTLFMLQAAGGSTFTPIFVTSRDTYRNDAGVGSNGIIPKPPAMTAGVKGGSLTWVIEVERLDLVYGI